MSYAIRFRPKDYHPCDRCETGWANASDATDADGYFITEYDSCFEHPCRILQEWEAQKKKESQKREPLFGANIGDAIKSIRGQT